MRPEIIIKPSMPKPLGVFGVHLTVVKHNE